MPTTPPVRVGIVGVGLMARYHLSNMLPRDDTHVVAVCEPSAMALDVASEEFTSRGLPVPPNEPDWRRFIERSAGELDAVFIITPHALHLAQRRQSPVVNSAEWVR